MLRICLATTLILLLASMAAADDWLRFRGTDSGGVAAIAQLPTQWGEKDHVAWKVEVAGKGLSSPIVIGDHVVITESSGFKQDRLHVLSYSAESGKLQWERQFWGTGRTMCHPMTAVAAPTPASDGKRVFALFSSGDLVGLDLDGNLLWLRALGLEHPAAGNDVGMSSSPVVAGETIIVQLESQGDGFAAGFEVATGQSRWQIDRPRLANWTSPIVLQGAAPGTSSVLLQSSGKISAHDPLTGKELWSFAAKCNDITSATAAEGVVYVPASGVQALRVNSDLSRVEPLWNSPKLTFGAASPIVHGGRIYTVNRAGVLVCGDASSGQVLAQLRLKGAFWGSPVIADGLMVLVNRDGLGQVVKLGDKPEIIGEGKFDEEVLASPAVAGGAMYVRSSHHLWKIAADAKDRESNERKPSDGNP